MSDGKYNFFYPNLCHVCTKRKKEMIICPRCRMISYCSIDHQKKHQPGHEQLCEVIQHVLGDREYVNTNELTWPEWNNRLLNFMGNVLFKIERHFTYSEEEMFRYPRACLVCYRQDGVIPCDNCPSANFCAKHKDDLEHAKYCEMENLVFRVDKYDSMCHNNDVTVSFKFPENTSFHNMSEFLRTQIEIRTAKSDDNTVKELSLIQYSDCVTQPLTFYFSIKKLKCPLIYENLIIHILAPSKTDVNFAEQWMLLLFLIPTIKSLTITLIGDRIEKTNSKRNAFLKGSLKNKEIFIIYCPMLYENYMMSENYEKPNFIICFDASVFDHTNSLNRSYLDNWMESIVAIAEQMCPCILAFYETNTGLTNEEIDKMKPRFYGKNPFASLRPYRKTSGDVFYRNERLIIL